MRVAVLISGRGSNLGALLEADLPVSFCGVISNRSDAAGLELARRGGVPALVVGHREFTDRVAFDEALARQLRVLNPQLVVLAGFMRVLGRAFVDEFQGRLINIHPSLLPSFPGLHTHQRALEAGVKVHGCTVHLVTEALDHGPILAQAAVPVLPADDAERLAARVLRAEHRLLPEVVRWFAEGRVVVDGGQARVMERQQWLLCE